MLNCSNGGAIVVAPAGHAQIPIIQGVRATGRRVIALDRCADAPGLHCADVGLSIDPACGADAAVALRGYPIDAVLCGGHDPSVIPLSDLARELGLETIPNEILRTCRYKHLARAWLAEHLPCYSTDYAVVADENALIDAWARIGPDVVVKPVDACGSRGVLVVRCQTELTWAFRQAIAFSGCGLVIIERFLHGTEVTLDGFVIDGAFAPVAATQRLLGPEPYRLLVGHIHPAPLDDGERDALHAAANRIVRAMRVRNGPVHSEWILTANGPRVLEFVYRLGGGCISAGLLPVGCGVSVVGASVALALGSAPDLKHIWDRTACLKFVTKPFPGPLTQRRQLKGRAAPGVLDVWVWDEDGRAENSGVNSACRAGWVIATGVDASEAVLRADNAILAMGVGHGDVHYAQR